MSARYGLGMTAFMYVEATKGRDVALRWGHAVFNAPSLKAVDRTPVPSFIATGMWKSYVRDGESLVPVPLPDPGAAEALHWQTEADLGFRLPGGYFNGPYGEDHIGIYGASPRYTSNMLRDVRYTDAAAIAGFEKEVVETTDAVSARTVDFLLGEDSLKSYAGAIDTQEAALAKIAKVTEADEVATALD